MAYIGCNSDLSGLNRFTLAQISTTTKNYTRRKKLIKNEKIYIEPVIHNKKRVPGIKRSIEEQCFYRYKVSANKRKIDFLISFEQFMCFWNKNCSYCGLEIQKIGIDRINSKIGYLIENLCACCARCNMSKMSHSKEDFLAHCKRIVEFNEK